MVIQMMIAMSGGRYDGQAWPPVGVDFEVPDEEGYALVFRDRVAVKVRDSPPRAVPAVAKPPEVAKLLQPEPEPEPEPEPAPDAVQPAPADSKQAWIDWAVSQGTDRDQAAQLTKNQLMAAYGGRL